MRCTFILLVVMGAMVGHAGAQPAPWQPERLTAGWTFTPGVALGGLWDNNVTVRNQGNPLIAEWVALVNPRGELQFNGRRTRFNAGYSGALEAYRTLSELNRYEQRARVALRHQFSPRLELESRASYVVTPTTDRLELGTLPFIDIGSTLADAGGALRYALSPRLRVEGDYRFQHVTFDRDEEFLPPAFLNDGYAHSPGARATYDISRHVSLGGEWQFRQAVINSAGDEQEFGVQNLLGEVGVQVGRGTTIRAAMGGSHLRMPATDLNIWGPAFRAGLEHQLERVSISARYFRSFVPSFSFGGLTGNQEIGAGVRVPLTSGGRLSLSGATTFNRTEPVEELGVGFQVSSLWVQGSVGYQATPWLRTEAFVSNTHQTSTARGTIDRLRIGIQFVTSKPVRIE